jgi:hypothetical protein
MKARSRDIRLWLDVIERLETPVSWAEFAPHLFATLEEIFAGCAMSLDELSPTGCLRESTSFTSPDQSGPRACSAIWIGSILASLMSAPGERHRSCNCGSSSACRSSAGPRFGRRTSGRSVGRINSLSCSPRAKVLLGWPSTGSGVSPA